MHCGYSGRANRKGFIAFALKPFNLAAVLAVIVSAGYLRLLTEERRVFRVDRGPSMHALSAPVEVSGRAGGWEGLVAGISNVARQEQWVSVDECANLA